ncbi:MAG: altronate dehydratase family protein [Desulfarculaceae bacterium]|nr:altronate dehydratase family protein [Desulfarculaceae bacterium]MCF8073109.1 altronate dehydratase family protein [Desulfarculaceae bacterium]MCF8101806.1 altronate dehydratase family protein [Desulfarculaceae bacterium]MCF8117370.1 altronate dehydratase family protein [Desulfarculaceae bacterium]
MSPSQPPVLLLHPYDDVLVALAELPAGTELAGHGLVCGQDIPAGHKVARRALPQGHQVRKYGQIIGSASEAVAAGDWVHTHNLAFGQFERDLAIGQDVKPTEYVAGQERATFQGYLRPSGQAATRNYLGVLATVNCSASVCHFIAQAASELLDDYPGVDGVVPLGHGFGCGGTTGSVGLSHLQRTMAGYARHPNFAGVLLVGLGCEVNQLELLMENMDLSQGRLLRAMNIQQAGGTVKTVEWAVEAIKEMLPEANKARRQSLPASHLKVGLECGGSDAYSGLTANPALGAAMDRLVAHGGTAILAETPEVYGAEHLLTRRAVSQAVGQKLAERIEWWEEYSSGHGATLNVNPTPGNKAGGLTTILEKSLGAVAKAGTTNLCQMYEYADAVEQTGLVMMDTPGYDMVSITGMVAGGANLICFTTGRGSVCGSRPAPTLKLATNSAMFGRMADDMDINCGVIADGEATVDQMGQVIFERILAAASGQPTKSEALGFGDQEFVPWQVGAVL